MENIIKILLESSGKLTKRGEQFHSMMNIGHIYHSIYKDGKKVLECIKKARKFADYAMTIPQNLVLFVDLLKLLTHIIFSIALEIPILGRVFMLW